ncbi:hypothetical protein BdWA1_003467 [Babesia duncani]|uniref:Uncharacterized protein n=1 Tax=Babesia duncani TaxID=323732 RepID=A0AAD9PI65_9APIC|nr:hypothetical protein BdWA1_003467 [Babesia duncani]
MVFVTVIVALFALEAPSFNCYCRGITLDITKVANYSIAETICATGTRGNLECIHRSWTDEDYFNRISDGLNLIHLDGAMKEKNVRLIHTTEGILFKVSIHIRITKIKGIRKRILYYRCLSDCRNIDKNAFAFEWWWYTLSCIELNIGVCRDDDNSNIKCAKSRKSWNYSIDADVFVTAIRDEEGTLWSSNVYKGIRPVKVVLQRLPNGSTTKVWFQDYDGNEKMVKYVFRNGSWEVKFRSDVEKYLVTFKKSEVYQRETIYQNQDH